jgi:hypothetical protein
MEDKLQKRWKEQQSNRHVNLRYCEVNDSSFQHLYNIVIMDTQTYKRIDLRHNYLTNESIPLLMQLASLKKIKFWTYANQFDIDELLDEKQKQFIEYTNKATNWWLPVVSKYRKLGQFTLVPKEQYTEPYYRIMPQTESEEHVIVLQDFLNFYLACLWEDECKLKAYVVTFQNDDTDSKTERAIFVAENDILVSGMYVEEHGHEAIESQQNSAYIQYIESTCECDFITI